MKLNPGGTHVWLADLRRPLKTDDSFTLTLRFEKAGERQVAVSVVAPTTLPLM